MNTSEVLNKAADLIEERGWGTGHAAMLGQSGVCIMGAIHHAVTGRFGDNYAAVHNCPAGQAVASYLELNPRRGSDGLWWWNDDLGDEMDEPDGQRKVVEVLRAAAVIEAARESEDPESFACPTCNLLVIDTDPSSDVFEVTVARHQDGACFGVQVRA
jgi:hypothetical protein